ncbi:AAA family ATPase [Gemmatimonas aurantiaca]|nr:AAA family ATPase [Gemmatimonas aurantiaca]
MKSITRFQPEALGTTDSLGSPKVISVMSGKGGSGKSVVAHNLALAAGQSGLKTLVVDFDWRLGSMHVLANAAVSSGIDDVIYNGAYISDCAVNIGLNTELLASASVISERDWPTDAEVFEFIQHCKETLFTYDLIVIDTPSGIQSQLRSIASASDALLLIVNPELTTIADSYGLLKWLLQADSNLNIYLLLNRVLGAKEATDIAERFTSLTNRFLNCKPQTIAFIQEDRQMRQAIARQRAVVAMAPESVIANQFQTLLSRLEKKVFTNKTAVRNLGNVQTTMNPITEYTDKTK